jgi:hypothetical protein
MEWLSPLAALYAAMTAIPLLLLLYFLKLKRREQMVSSTFLWKRAVQDLQVNAPFQRLRRNILLLLQLLMLIAILLALAWPILSLVAGPAQRYVLLIDHSASMNAVDVTPGSSQDSLPPVGSGQSRLDKAKQQAKVFVESLRSGKILSLRDDSDRMMVVAFDNYSRVICNFTSDKQQLISAIEAIEPGNGKSSLAQAIVFAGAFAQSSGTETDKSSSERPPKLLLFSDGQISDLGQLSIAPDEMTFHCIGQTGSNIAVTAMQGQRSYENPDEVEVFATIVNYDTQEVTTDVQLSINGDVRSVKSVTIPAATAKSEKDTLKPGRTAVNFLLTGADSGLLEVRQMHPDYLSCDDSAWSILSPPKKLSVLLVTKGNIVLESALQACSFSKFESLTPEQFETADNSFSDAGQSFDIIVLDNFLPRHLGKGRYIVFGKPPDGIDVTVTGQLENQTIADWRQKHSVLKYVNLTNLFAAKCYKINLPGDAEVLAEFNETPAIAIVRRTSSIFLLANFDILQTNWPFEPGFVMFCYNAAASLGMQSAQNQQTELPVGDPIIVEGLAPGIVAEINGPGFSGETVQSNPTGTVRFANTSLVGPYRLSIQGQPDRLFAVNLLDEQESNIAPNRALALAGQQIEAQSGTLQRANVPLWPYLVFFVLIIACLEWLVYTRKVKI